MPIILNGTQVSNEILPYIDQNGKHDDLDEVYYNNTCVWKKKKSFSNRDGSTLPKCWINKNIYIYHCWGMSDCDAAGNADSFPNEGYYTDDHARQAAARYLCRIDDTKGKGINYNWAGSDKFLLEDPNYHIDYTTDYPSKFESYFYTNNGNGEKSGPYSTWMTDITVEQDGGRRQNKRVFGNCGSFSYGDIHTPGIVMLQQPDKHPYDLYAMDFSHYNKITCHLRGYRNGEGQVGLGPWGWREDVYGFVVDAETYSKKVDSCYNRPTLQHPNKSWQWPIWGREKMGPYIDSIPKTKATYTYDSDNRIHYFDLTIPHDQLKNVTNGFLVIYVNYSASSRYEVNDDVWADLLDVTLE